MVKTIAFHSYKGGTGKTTIAANLSTLLVSKGFNVLLIDMDVYAPSLHVYFNSKPEKWMNNYLLDDLEFADFIGLTTISQSLDESGRIAVELLLARLTDPLRAVQHVQLPLKLIQRQTA